MFSFMHGTAIKVYFYNPQKPILTFKNLFSFSKMIRFKKCKVMLATDRL